MNDLSNCPFVIRVFQSAGPASNSIDHEFVSCIIGSISVWSTLWMRTVLAYEARTLIIRANKKSHIFSMFRTWNGFLLRSSKFLRCNRSETARRNHRKGQVMWRSVHEHSWLFFPAFSQILWHFYHFNCVWEMQNFTSDHRPLRLLQREQAWDASQLLFNHHASAVDNYLHYLCYPFECEIVVCSAFDVIPLSIIQRKKTNVCFSSLLH